MPSEFSEYHLPLSAISWWLIAKSILIGVATVLLVLWLSLSIWCASAGDPEIRKRREDQRASLGMTRNRSILILCILAALLGASTAFGRVFGELRCVWIKPQAPSTEVDAAIRHLQRHAGSIQEVRDLVGGIL